MESIKEIKEKDKVLITQSLKPYKHYKDNIGWSDDMKHTAGKIGKVIVVDHSDQTVCVKVGGGGWWYKPRDLTVQETKARPKDELGAKFDAGKLLWRPLMKGLAMPLRSLAAVLSYGAQKYAEDSWQTVPGARERYENAYGRHMNKRDAGEVYDDESGLPHIAHMIINLMFVMWFEIKDGVITNIDKFKEPPKK